MRLHSLFTGSRLNRRTIAAVAALALVSAPMVGQIPHASAFESWCFDDPVVTVNGFSANISVGLQSTPANAHLYADAATITVHVPVGATATVTKSPTLYLNESVVIVKDLPPNGTHVPIQVTATVHYHPDQKTNAQLVVGYHNNTQHVTGNGTTWSTLSANVSDIHW